jgi:hypothetical protein
LLAVLVVVVAHSVAHLLLVVQEILRQFHLHRVLLAVVRCKHLPQLQTIQAQVVVALPQLVIQMCLQV